MATVAHTAAAHIEQAGTSATRPYTIGSMDKPDRDEPGSLLPDDLAELVDYLFRRLGAATGNWRLEFHATDGHCRGYRREEHGDRPSLARFATPSTT